MFRFIRIASERCRSGRTGRSRKPLTLHGVPGFESLSLRHFNGLRACFHCKNRNTCPHDIPHIDAACPGILRNAPLVSSGTSVERLPAFAMLPPKASLQSQTICPSSRFIRIDARLAACVTRAPALPSAIGWGRSQVPTLWCVNKPLASVSAGSRHE